MNVRGRNESEWSTLSIEIVSFELEQYVGVNFSGGKNPRERLDQPPPRNPSSSQSS
jgi:hypothetical protein